MSTRTERQRWLAIGLGATLIALLLPIAWISWQDRHDADNRAIDVDQLIRLQVERKGRPSMVLEREEGAWRLTRPCTLAANQGRLEPLLAALSGFEAQYEAYEVDRQAAGLDDPEATLTLDDRRFRIGARDASGERRYVQLDEQVGFIPEWLLSLVDGGLSALARLDIFDDSLLSMQGPDTSDATRPDWENSDAADQTLQAWRALSAVQIVTWPRQDAPVERSRQVLGATYANDTNRDWILVRNDRYVALFEPQAGCAYILDPAEVPETG